MKNVNSVYLRCEDHLEVLAFNRYEYEDGDVDFEINIEDSYCGGYYSGIIGRFKRAWKSFFGKPVCYSGAYIENPDRVKDFLQKCMELVNNGEQIINDKGHSKHTFW